MDQGTSGTRCSIVDKECNIIRREYVEHRQIYPVPGWVEHDPLEIWEKVRYVIKAAARNAKLERSSVSAIGIANQRETVVVWDKKSLRPVYNAIVWQDTRTSSRCASLQNDKETRRLISSKTGLAPFSYFSATKIEWILDNVPGARERAERGELAFGNIDSWIIINLTKNKENGQKAHVTDYTNASRTMLMDIRKLEWSEELLKLFRVPEVMMPEIHPSSDREFYGMTDLLGSKVPICGDLGDQQAALIGQICFREGEAKNTYGTGSFFLENIGNRFRLSKNGLLTTIAYGMERGRCDYALEGSIAITGGLVKWFKDNLGLIRSSEDVERLARSVGEKGSASVYFVPAFVGLFAPHWDPYSRGSIFGLTQYTRKEHIVHAALESICFQTRDVVEAAYRDTQNTLKSLKVDGGASENDYLMQLQSDLLGITLTRSAEVETTSLGAAFAAGLAAGYWTNIGELQRLWKADRIFKPKIREIERRKLYHGWQVAVKRTRNWLKEIEEI